MPKRKSDQESLPIVEKLYRDNQPNFYAAGGFLDDDDEAQERREEIAESRQRRFEKNAMSSMPDDCSKCRKPLLDSWLWEKFSCAVCDTCRDDKGEHKLIARTEAKNEFMLKDCDFDLRKPILRFYSKKNPHNPRYGDMKLYLRSQVIERMIEVHGGWDELNDLKLTRQEKKDERTERNFEKKVKEMRQQLRGMSGTKARVVATHDHVYGDETYDEAKDLYSKECLECGFVNSYEKM